MPERTQASRVPGNPRSLSTAMISAASKRLPRAHSSATRPLPTDCSASLAARVVPAAKLPPNVVAIGRPVTYRDESTGRETTVTPIFPEDADIAQGLISIKTPIGVLIGLAEGSSLDWEPLDGKQRMLTALRVSPQEAAEGHDT